MKLFSILAPIVFLLPACATAQLPVSTDVVEPQTGISFPSTIEFSEGGAPFTLRLTGVTVRKKWFFKVYAIAHYLDKQEKVERLNSKIILTDGPTKQITLEYVRNVSAHRLTSVLREDFQHNTTPSEFRQIKLHVKRVLNYFNRPVRKGDVFIMRWLSGGRVVLELNDEKLGSVQDELFARTLWSIWFGKHAVVDPEALMVKYRLTEVTT